MIIESNDFDIENWWNETSTVVQGLIGGAIAAFLLSIMFAMRLLFKSDRVASDSVALLNDEELDNEEIWTKKQQPPAYVEEEEKQPFLTDDK
jgi:hypothetical protein